MTDLIERVEAAYSEGDEPASKSAQDRAPTTRGGETPQGARGRNRPVHVLFAVAAGGSAVLLFAMASGHWHGARATIGIIAALAQVAVAVGAFSRPSRALFWTAAAVNVAIGVFWAVAAGSHTVSSATAGIGIALSALAVVIGAVLAVRPDIGARWSSVVSVIGSLVPLAVVVVTMVGLFATTTAASTPPAHAASAGNSSAALAEATTVKVPGENSKTFKSTVAGNATEQSELKKFVPLDPLNQALESQQLAQAQQAALRFPTFGSAKAAGMILAGGMAPGVGAHMQNFGNTFSDVNPDGTINAADPASWIYAGTGPNDPVVGLMYTSFGKNPPAGFAGPNDHWHQHSNVCVKFANGMIAVPFAVDQDVTPQECADAHGTFMKKTVWMVHAWVVPGWESPQGVFSHDNLHVYCPGNTDLTNAIGMCNRQS
jgi:hypothetical protein